MFKYIENISVRQKIFLSVLVFGLAISFAGAFSSYLFRLHQARVNIHDSIEANIDSSEELLRIEVDNLKRTILSTGEIFSGEKSLYSPGGDVEENLPYLKAFMLTISKVNNSIMQFRMIDKEGYEKIRIERFKCGEDPKIITGERLQNKSLRYYFKEGVKIEKGEVWVSELDTNIEFGTVEFPERNTYRLVTPCVVNGSLEGVLVINAFADRLLALFRDIPNVHFYLADNKGDYLKGSADYARDKNGNLFEQFSEVKPVQVFGSFYDEKSLVARKIELDDGRWFYVAYRISKEYIWKIHKQQIIISFFLYLVSGAVAALVSYLFSGYSADIYNKKVNEAEDSREQMESMKNKVGELTKRIHKDPLTKIHNRRYYNEFVKNRLGVNIRFAMMVLDIDHFKNVNDDYGHDVGDRVLILLAELLQQNIRETDMLVRWGGEEFCIIIFDSVDVSAYDIAEKLRAKVEDHDFKLGRRLTCSIGVSSRISNESADDVFKRSDQALYQAKKSGRNKVVII